MKHVRFTERGLAMQGFPNPSGPAIRKVEPWLRLTPLLNTLWIAAGTALESPATLLGFSLVSALGATRQKHPFDQLYNRGVRRLAKSEPLPDNPPPRRFAMGLAAAWAATAAALLLTSRRRAGLVAGGLLAVAGATVSSTHFCLGSWTYRQLERLRSLPSS
jgi:hypothetical protein